MNGRLALVFLLITCARVSYGAPITIDHSGTITQVPIDDLYGDIAAGSTVQISYTFDSTAVDLIPADSATASYASSGVPFTMTFSFPGHVFTADGSVQIGIFNSFVDQYTVLGTGNGGNLTLELFLQDNGATAFSDDSLPLSAPSLAAFTVADFHFHEIGDDGRETQFDGQLTGTSAAVPEPSTAVALLLGLGVLAALRPNRNINLPRR